MNEQHLIPLILSGMLLMVMFVLVILSFIVIQKQKQRRHKVEKSEMEVRFRNELLQTRLEVQEHALNSISRELHDNISQMLGMARMTLFTAMREENKTEADKLIDSSKEVLGEAITGLRNLSHMLNSSMLHRLGLTEAIHKEIANVAAAYRLPGKLLIQDDNFTLSPDQELILFRIIQEAVSNITRHAHATAYNINMDYNNNLLCITVTDDGTGFTGTIDQKAGIGLINMRERMHILGGEAETGNNPEGGAFVRLTLKLTNTP